MPQLPLSLLSLARDTRPQQPLPRLDASLWQPVHGQPCFGSTEQLAHCGAACCVGGIWLDALHAQRILAAEALIAPLLPADRQSPDSWFSDEVVEHSDFPSGVGTATAVLERPDGSGRQGCAFVLADHRCALQVAGMAAGLPWPGLKPFDCATYPVLRSEGELLWDRESAEAEHGVDCQLGGTVASGEAAPFYAVFATEVAYAVGEAGLAAVQAVAEHGDASKAPQRG